MKSVKKLLPLIMSAVILAGCSSGKAVDSSGDTSQKAEETQTASEADAGKDRDDNTDKDAGADKTESIENDNEKDTVEDVYTPVTFTDALDRSVTVSEKPERVAAMIGSFAQIWELAGGTDSLVAAASDAWTAFDIELGPDVVDLGEAKAPSLETLISTKPDLVIASTNMEADVDMLDSLEKAGINVAYFDVDVFDDYLDMIKVCTDITGCSENYEKYGEDVQKQVENARSMADGSKPKVLYLRASRTAVKAKGSDGNVLGEMLRDLDCNNIADSDKGLLENISMEKILTEDPEKIFVIYQQTTGDDAEQIFKETILSNPAWSDLTAVKNDEVYYLDQYLYNFKPNAKWGDAYEELAKILYVNE